MACSEMGESIVGVSVGLLLIFGVGSCIRWAGTPNYKAGECISKITSKERWENKEKIIKVLEVGKNKYLLENYAIKPEENTVRFGAVDNGYRVVPCGDQDVAENNRLNN